MLSGTCAGGPCDGLPLHHPEPLCEFYMRAGRLITFSRAPGGLLPPDVTAGAYEFEGGEWRWKGNPSWGRPEPRRKLLVDKS